MGYFEPSSCKLDDFGTLTSQKMNADDVPNSAAIEKNVPLYDMTSLRPGLDDPGRRKEIMDEWGKNLLVGSGIVVLKAAFADLEVIDRASNVFNDIIRREREANAGKGDHFAAAGANDRVWNSLQKQCLEDPEGFARYYGNVAIDTICEAWLGPHYQMTAQVNLVRPGGKAQSAHRDYHLGFQKAEVSQQFPAHAHEVTATLTLQGAIAHCDMPLESGPTKLLPFSQAYGPGYLAFHQPEFADYFEENHIQLPLAKGDAVFFNPALFHAAGENRSNEINRMANLLQISSAFGRAMEAIDRYAMCRAVFPALVALKQNGLTDAELAAAIAATAEGYSFPTNLDTDPPVGGNAPETQADILRSAVSEDWTTAQLTEALDQLRSRSAA